MIDYVLDPTTTARTAQNVKDQTAYGLELELEYPFSDYLSVRGNYSYQHSEDSDTKERVAGAPIHQGFAQIQYKTSSDWNINNQYS